MSEPRRVKRGWMNLRVTEVIDETHDTKTFVMIDADEGGRPFDYVAGQYLTFRFDDLSDKPIVRSYTMSSSPIQGDFSAFTVKRVEQGLVSNWLCDQVKVGSILRARGPIGKFTWDAAHDRQHLMMVAGGSGVTPFVSIMREFAAKVGANSAPMAMTLLVSYRSQQDLILWKDLEQLNSSNGCRVFTTLSRDPSAPTKFWQGRIDRAMMARALAASNFSAGETTFMTCGPEVIMNSMTSWCQENGVAAEHIKTESFF